MRYRLYSVILYILLFFMCLALLMLLPAGAAERGTAITGTTVLMTGNPDTNGTRKASFRFNTEKKTLDLFIYFEKSATVQMQLVDEAGAVLASSEQKAVRGENRFPLQKLDTLPKGLLTLQVNNAADGTTASYPFVMF